MIDKLTMLPPHRIVARSLAHAAGLGHAQRGDRQDAWPTRSLAFGLALRRRRRHRRGAASATAPCARRSIRCSRPTTPIPIFAFYPLFIVLFGLGDAPQILIGFLLGVVAVIVNTLNGLDRVPRVLLQDGADQRLGPIETGAARHAAVLRRPTC